VYVPPATETCRIPVQSGSATVKRRLGSSGGIGELGCEAPVESVIACFRKTGNGAGGPAKVA